MGANDPRYGAIFDPREDCFHVFSHDAPGRGPIWTQVARLAGFIKRTSIHCYTQKMKAHGLVFQRRRFCYVFPIVRLLELSVAMETSSDPI